MLEVMVQNLNNYGYGKIVLPASAEEVSDFFELLNPGGFHDCEVVDVEIVEEAAELALLNGLHNLTFSELNTLAHKLEESLEFAYVFMACDSLEEAIEKFDNGDYRIYFDCYNDYDLGYEIATDLGIVPNNNSLLSRYFDYESFGRDCRLEGDFSEVVGGVFVEIIW